MCSNLEDIGLARLLWDTQLRADIEGLLDWQGRLNESGQIRRPCRQLVNNIDQTYIIVGLGYIIREIGRVYRYRQCQFGAKPGS